MKRLIAALALAWPVMLMAQEPVSEAPVPSKQTADYDFELAKTELGFTWGELSYKHYISHWLKDDPMAIFFFVVGLAFLDPLLLDEAKLGIFVASLGSGIMGYLLLRGFCRSRPRTMPPENEYMYTMNIAHRGYRISPVRNQRSPS